MTFMLRCLMVLSLCGSIFASAFFQPIGPKTNSSSEYVENFSSNQYKSYADKVDWNTANQQLTLLKDSAGWYTEPDLQPDGTGGSYVVWTDIRNNNRDGNWDVYAQRLDQRGNRRWAQDLRVDSDIKRRFQRYPQTAVDSSGNLIVAWKDARDDAYLSIYAQKISPDGQKLWPGDVLVNGKPSYPVSWDFAGAVALGIDQNDQVVIAWVGNQDNDWSQPTILSQRLSPNGERLWTQDVLAGRVHSGNLQTSVALAVGTQNNTYIAWIDKRDGGEDVYAGQLDAGGTDLWPTDVKVSAGLGITQQGSLDAVTDANNNFIVVWRNGSPYNPTGADGNTILAQKVSFSGQLLWTGNIRANQNATLVYRGYPKIGILQNGSALIAWVDDRKGYSATNIYAQLLDSGGEAQWTDDHELSPETWWGQELGGLVVQGTTAFLTWQRWGDVYMQMIDLSNNAPIIPIPPQVNDSDGKAGQFEIDLVPRRDGSALAVWVDNRRNGNDIRAEAFGADGTPTWNHSIQVNKPDPGDQYLPQAAVNLHAKTLIIWNHEAKSGIYGQILDENGLRLFPGDITVNADLRLGNFGAVTALPDGTFVVAWPGLRDPTLEYWDIFLQRIDEQGQRMWKTDFRVNQSDYIIPLRQVDRRNRPALAVDAQGQIIVAWRGDTGAGVDVFMQRISPAGEAVWATDLPMNAHLDPAGAGGEAVCAVVASDIITAAWKSDTQEDSGIYTGQFDLNGSPVSGPIRVSSDAKYYFYGNPDLNVAPNGDIFIAWDDEHSGGRNVYTQLLSPQGNARWAQPLVLNEYFAWATHPAATWMANGTWMVGWHDVRFGASSLFARAVTQDGRLLWNTDIPLREQLTEQFYQPVGQVESLQINTSEAVEQATLFTDQSLQGGAIRYFLSNTGGQTWDEVIPGERLIFSSNGSDLRWKAVLTATVDGIRTPQINQIRVAYYSQVAGDIFEPDDSCNTAQIISSDGMVQQHSFDPAGDSDWVYFPALEGYIYILQASNTGPKADVNLDVYDSCGGSLLAQGRNALGNELHFSWIAPANGYYYIHLYNLNTDPAGADTNYSFSVWNGIQQWPVALIVAGHDDNYSVQTQINNSADFAYRILVNRLKIPKNRVRYFSPYLNRDVDGNGQDDDLAGLPLPASVQESIQSWTAKSSNSQQALHFYLYLIDHGTTDRVRVNGRSDANSITAKDLNLWLDNLESQIRVDSNIIIDTCRSGSFIDKTTEGPDSLSGLNRVIITSTSSSLDAFAPGDGALFSDPFWTAMGNNLNLERAFQFAQQSVNSYLSSQEPWLDDNGDAIADSHDGSLARSRGLGSLSAVETIPVIDTASVTLSPEGKVTISVQARDDTGLRQVQVMVFPANFQQPLPNDNGIMSDFVAPLKTLTPQGNQQFSLEFPLTDPGGNRLVLYAVDMDGNQSLPIVRWIRLVYLPMVQISH